MPTAPKGKGKRRSTWDRATPAQRRKWVSMDRAEAKRRAKAIDAEKKRR